MDVAAAFRYGFDPATQVLLVHTHNSRLALSADLLRAWPGSHHNIQSWFCFPRIGILRTTVLFRYLGVSPRGGVRHDICIRTVVDWARREQIGRAARRSASETRPIPPGSAWSYVLVIVITR